VQGRTMIRQNERYKFFNDLKHELADAVPRYSLTITEKTQLDKSLNERRRYLISIRIDYTNTAPLFDKYYDYNAASLIKHIDNIVKNKDQYPFGSGQVTRYLDETYGFISVREYLSQVEET